MRNSATKIDSAESVQKKFTVKRQKDLGQIGGWSTSSLYAISYHHFSDLAPYFPSIWNLADKGESCVYIVIHCLGKVESQRMYRKHRINSAVWLCRLKTKKQWQRQIQTKRQWTIKTNPRDLWSLRRQLHFCQVTDTFAINSVTSLALTSSVGVKRAISTFIVIPQ